MVYSVIPIWYADVGPPFPVWEWLDVANLRPINKVLVGDAVPKILSKLPRLFHLSHLGLVGVPDLGNGVGWIDCNPLDHGSNRDGGIAATLG